MIRFARILALIIIPPTLIALWINGRLDGVETLYFLLPDIVVCAALLAGVIHGGRAVLLAAHSLAAGVFLTATLGDYWTEGLVGVPPGAAIGTVACAVMIGFLLRGK